MSVGWPRRQERSVGNSTSEEISDQITDSGQHDQFPNRTLTSAHALPATDAGAVCGPSSSRSRRRSSNSWRACSSDGSALACDAAVVNKTSSAMRQDLARLGFEVPACGYHDLPTELQAQARDECLALLKPSRSALSATIHKKNNTDDPSSREADKHKLVRRRAGQSAIA